MLSLLGKQLLCVSLLGSEGANKLVNQFASDRFRPLNRSRSDFWIQMRVPSLTCSGVIVGAVSGLDSVGEEFSLEAMHFHDCSFRGWKVSESVTLMSGS